MKTQDTYQSILRGVSQQAPSERIEGQHGEQVNMISDPVNGLTRRAGLLLVDETLKDISDVPDSSLSDAIADSYSYRAFPFSIYTNHYDLLYRSRRRQGAQSEAHLPPVSVFTKQGVRRWLDVVTDPLDTRLEDYWAGGLSSLVVLGRMVLMAGNEVRPNVQVVDHWGDDANQDKAVIYVKTGQYSKTYRVRAKIRSTGLSADVSYTTPASYYDGQLVVDDLNPADPDYQFYLNNRIYAHEQATANHTLAAAEAIIPSSIAAELLTKLHDAGQTGWVRDGAYLRNTDIETLAVGDDSVNDQLLATHNDAVSESQLSPRHFNGKVVKITPIKGSDEGYYLKAYTDGGHAFGLVTWRETAGEEVIISDMLAYGTLENETFYVASSPERLRALVLDEEAVTIAVPSYVPSMAGDLGTMPKPAFADAPIDLLAIFQDRLIVGTGNILRLSRTGDYLNFFRTSALTVRDDDPAEIFAAGTQGDVIRKAALYDRNMTFYGDNYHYVLPGRSAFDPKNPQLAVQYEIHGTGRSQPAVVGDKVFVMKEDTALAGVQMLQLNPGVWQDSPQIDTVTKQLRTYINGTPAEMVAVSAPNTLFARTEFINRSGGAYPNARPFGIYTFGYMDGPEGRVQEAWSAWEWAAALGTPFGLSSNGSGDGIMLYTLAVNTLGGVLHRGLMALEGSARAEPSGLPMLDAMRPADYTEPTLITPTADQRVAEAVRTVRDASYSTVAPSTDDFTRWAVPASPYYTSGDAAPQAVDPLRWQGVRGWGADWVTVYGETLDGVWTGLNYASFVDLTSPIMRNHEDKARLYGYLTLTKLRIQTARTGGIQGWVTHPSGTDRSLFYDGGYKAIDYEHSLFVGRRSQDVQMRIASVDWHPLTITSIAWQGDWKNNQGRIR